MTTFILTQNVDGNVTFREVSAATLSLFALDGLGNPVMLPRGIFANASHSHAQTDITGLQTTLDGKGSLAGTNAWTGINTWNSTTLFEPGAGQQFFVSATGNASIAFTTQNGQIGLAPNGGGTLLLLPASVGSMDNVAIGGTTPAAGTFTNLTIGPTDTLSWSSRVAVVALGNSTLRLTNSSNSRGVVFDADTDGLLKLRNRVNSADASIACQSVMAGGGITYGQSTVGTLPTASTNARMWIEVTDANGPAAGATVAGGGAVRALVRSNGTNWIVRMVL
ncbi:hypothetical protein OKA04_12320 [Luteolibacter flavescens]|uniref:Uncharacterized protein n=1 Tax=Luteolibacter flavescens TaxID=1859460 RepID=A0ABT3FQK7_9BACT|nr:hypothetical protein [Luteolibacter flavescens]MCW1885516.1 hypothetical protein [Luteolibacter flavescens]